MDFLKFLHVVHKLDTLWKLSSRTRFLCSASIVVFFVSCSCLTLIMISPVPPHPTNKFSYSILTNSKTGGILSVSCQVLYIR